MSARGQRRLRRRVPVRRAASTSRSSPPRPRWRAGRRRLDALASAIDVALCRLQYYLDRTAAYQVELQTSNPFEDLAVTTIDESFRTDVKTYLLALRSDGSRLEAAQKAVEAALGAAGAARSARRRPPPGFSSSSSESEGAQGTNSRTPQRRQRLRARHTASGAHLPAAGDETESAAEREDSSGDEDAAGARRGSAGGGRGPAGVDAGSGGRGSPSGGGEDHRSGGAVTGAGGDATPPCGTAAATEHTTDTGWPASNCGLPATTGEENGGGQKSSMGGDKVQAVEDACGTKVVGTGSSRKSSVGTNSSNSSRLPAVGSARSGATTVGGSLTGTGRTTAWGGAARPPSPHPFAPPPMAGPDASSTAREVLRELFRMYGLLRRLLGLHSQRLLRRTCAAALQLAEGRRLSLEQLSLQQPLSRAQLQRAVAAAEAELLRASALLSDCEIRARAFCEVARRLRAFRPRKPPRRPRRRRCSAGAAAAAPPAVQPTQTPRPQSRFWLERLLSLFLCWTRPCSD